MFKFILLTICFAHFIGGCESSKSKLPSNIDQRLYCLGCIATVKEMNKILSKRRVTDKNRESKVMELMENVCSADNFVQYEYSPPKTESACKLLLENHEEEIETIFVKNKSDKEKIICYEISEACEGIDTKQQPPSSNAEIDLSNGKEGETVSKTVTIDPSTGKAEPVKRKSEGKTISKKDRKKKDKKQKKKKTKKSKAKKTKDKKDDEGTNFMNVDVNDPAAMEKVMAQIKEITKQNQNNKEEL